MSSKYIICIQCGEGFVFSEEEEKHFQARGFSIPKRCPECRNRKQKAFGDIEDLEKGHRRNKRRRERKPDRYIS